MKNLPIAISDMLDGGADIDLDCWTMFPIAYIP
jgi:hypothetical protein